EVEVRRNHPAAQRQHRLDQPGEACRGLEVTDVRLDGADEQRPVCGTPGMQRGERVHFNRVAELRACAVRLDVTHVGGGQVRCGECGAHHIFLRHAVWRGQTAAASILV